MEESSSEKFIKSPEEEPLEQNTASTPKTVHLLTPNDDDNDSASELSDGDLVPDRSAECSPMLTPNTIQEAVVGAEESPVPIEDTLRKSALEGLTHDFLHVNLEEEKKDELPTDEEESIPEEQQLPEGDEDEEEEEEEETKEIRFVVPSAEKLLPAPETSNIYEEETKVWFIEELPNLVKMFPVQTIQNPVTKIITPEEQDKFERKVQSWVDASLCNKLMLPENVHGKCEILYDLEARLQEEEKELSVHASVTDQACGTQTVTVKFLINEAYAFAHAFEICSYMQDIKESLAKTFKCQPTDLMLIRGGKMLSDSLRISELGVEPYGTVEIEIQAKGLLKMESMYQIPPIVPDVITVRVESATEEVRDVVVEIESRCMRKPFVGGYRHKSTGVEYHHAFTQTPSPYYKVSAEGKISRDTQTATCKEKLQNTTYDASTQMARADHFVPRESDKILSTGKFTSVDDYDKVDYDKMAIIIQRHWRGYAARKKFKEMLASYRQFLMWDQTEAERLERERHNRLRKEIVHKVFPRTRADYEMLYAMIENWRKAEIKRISSMKTMVPKKAEFCLLLQKEIESLRTIEKYRLELKKEKMAKKELDILEKCATPITWTGYKGIEVSMETIHIQRAKELKELYYIMCQNDISVEERIELLISLKYALKSYNPMMTNELISLFEREVNCLVRGVKAKDLILLRLRTQKLFIELMKDPEFNPEAAKHTVFDWEENVGKMYFCQRCQTLKPMTDFAVFDKKLDKCISCAWLDDIGRTRIDFQPYRFIIRALQREERRRKCFTSMAFIMQDKDFYYLIVQIWHCKSALSEETDISKLCLGRWDVSNDWTPWNSVLLTTSEMKAHVNLDDFHKSYQDQFLEQVGYKNKLARFHFSHLFKFDKQYTESGLWFAESPKKYKPPPSGSGDS